MNRIIATAVVLFACATTAFAAVTITTTSKTFTKDGGAASVSTGGTGTWEATTDATWISFTRASGNAGVSCVYTVSANFSADTRSAVIDIGGNAYTVTQTGYTATLSPASLSIGCDGGSGTVSISVDAGVSWSATANADWLSVTPSSGMSAGSVTYSVAPNEGTTTRTGSITIAGQTFSVTQTGTDVALSEYLLRCGPAPAVFEIVVSALSSTHWSVTPNDIWTSVVDEGYGRGNSSIMVAVGQNPSVLPRTGTFSVGSKTLTVIQSGMTEPTLAITPAEATAAAVGAYANVAVYSTPDSPWVAESRADWITLSDGLSGAGNGNTKYVAAANPLLEPRTGEVAFRQFRLEPEDDLDAGRAMAFDETTKTDLATSARTVSRSLSSSFDGTFAITISGAPLPKQATRDWSVALEFRIGELNSVNRLLELFGSHSIYVDAYNRLCVDNIVSSFSVATANEDYRLVFCQENDGSIRLYSGKKGDLATEAASRSAEIMEDLTVGETPVATAFKLGQTSRPSSGNLRNGKIGRFDFWGRALTAVEANRYVQALPDSRSDNPNAIPEETTCTLFRCAMNGYGSVSTNDDWKSAFEIGSSVAGWSESKGRYGQALRALSSFGSGTFSIGDLNNVFAGTSLVNGGYDLNADHYGYMREKTINGKEVYCYFPSPVSKTSGSDNASYVFWIYVDALPSGSATIFQRTRTNGSETDAYGRVVNSYVSNNTSLKLELLETGHLKVSQNGAETTLTGARVRQKKWTMVSLSGEAQRVISIYIDGEDSGNVTTVLSFGYMPPTDCRYKPRTGAVEGYISETVQKLVVGGWDGALDDVMFFDKALTSAEVRALYEATKPLEIVHTVTQGVIEPVVSPSEVSFGAAGGSTNVVLTVPSITQWTAESGAPWITVTSSSSSAGSARVSFDVSANPSTEARTGTLALAGKTVTVRQAGLWSQLSYDGTVFNETSDSGWIDVQVEGDGDWTASTDADWLTLLDTEGHGSGSVMFVVDDFNTTVASRTATVTIAGKTVTVTQRGYELSIDPMVAEIGSNAGAGEIGVTAPIGAVWEALVTADWITLVGGATGMGNGTLRYTVSDNTTGGTRTGKIVISGQEYTITQRPYLTLEAVVDGEGSVAGAGNFDTNERATLTATPAAGYAFSHWTGDAVGVSNVVSFTMDSSKTVTAHFIPEGAAQRLAEEKAAQGGFYTRDQIHNLEIGNLLFDVDSGTGKARIGVQLQETSDLAHPDWKPVSVTVQDLDVGSDGSVGIKAPATGNAKFFRVVSGE